MLPEVVTVFTLQTSHPANNIYVFNGFVTYQGLASSEDGDKNGGGKDEDEDKDKDSILPSILEQHFEGQVPLDNW